jgi:hypothetical protein
MFVKQRRFEHLVVELSVSVGRIIPRYALWLLLQEQGWDPVVLGREDIKRFCDDHLPIFLADHGLTLGERRARALRKRLLRFDPRHPTPEETMERIFGPTARH